MKDDKNESQNNENIINEDNNNENKEDEEKNNKSKAIQLKVNSKEDFQIEDPIPQPDFSKLDNQDPSLKEGYKLVFEKEVPMDLKIENKKGQKDISSFEAIIFKVLKIQTSSQSIPSHIRIELFSENDLFFHFTSIIDEEIFNVMKEKQDITIDYKDFIILLEELCDNCINDSESFICIFIMKKNGNASLEIIKNIDVKYLELLKIEFINSSDEVIIKQMQYRFASVKSKFDYYKDCLQIAGDIILDNNPSIISQMLEYDKDSQTSQKFDLDNNF